MSGMEGSPVAPNAPKFGTLVPNRLFVGGISASTTEAELAGLFSKFGNVRAAKIIADRAGVSKGYGFVTFETEEEARRIQKEADKLILKDRKLNIAPAIKKQPFTRIAVSEAPPPMLKDHPPATPLYLEPSPVLANGLYNPPPYSYGTYFGDPAALMGAFPAAAPPPQVPMYYPTVPPGPYYVTASPQYPVGNIMYCSVLEPQYYHHPHSPLAGGGSEASSSKSSEAASSPPPVRPADATVPFRPL